VRVSELELDDYITRLAQCLDSRLLNGAVGLEGPPFAGKSTLVSMLASATGAVVVSEHTDFDPVMRTLALEKWPESVSDAVNRQRAFVEVELLRAGEADRIVQSGQVALMDRTALSVVIYSVARAVSDDCKPLLDDAVHLSRTALRLPERLILLDADPTLLRERAARLIARGTPRPIESYLLLPDTLTRLRKYYALLATRVKRCHITVIRVTDDIKHPGAHECHTLLSDTTELWPPSRLLP
jgi:thymidylate kinase